MQHVQRARMRGPHPPAPLSLFPPHKSLKGLGLRAWRRPWVEGRGGVCGADRHLRTRYLLHTKICEIQHSPLARPDWADTSHPLTARKRTPRALHAPNGIGNAPARLVSGLSRPLMASRGVSAGSPLTTCTACSVRTEQGVFVGEFLAPLKKEPG
jgi:hypothetical protein